MQELLRDAGFRLDIDGDDGPATEKAVKAFQKAKGLQVDGTCGNETWSVLREGPREAVGTDGRKPHTFVDQGLKARWQREREHCILFGDEGSLFVNAVGDVPDSDKKKATVRVTPPRHQGEGRQDRARRCRFHQDVDRRDLRRIA